MKSQNPGTVMVHKMFNQAILILWSYPQALVRAQAKQRASTPSRTLPNNMWDINLLELTSNRSQPGFQLPLPSPLLHLRHNPGPGLGCHSAPSGQGGQNMQICKEQNAKCKMQRAKCKMQNAKCKMQNAKCKCIFPSGHGGQYSNGMAIIIVTEVRSLLVCKIIHLILFDIWIMWLRCSCSFPISFKQSMPGLLCFCPCFSTSSTQLPSECDY